MTTAGVLDDYLEQLLGDAVPAAPVQADASTPPTAAVAAQDDAEADGVARAISAEFARHALADAGTDPDSDAPAPEAQFDTPTAAGAPANLALLDELMNDPALGPPVETLATVHDTPTSPGAPANLALLEITGVAGTGQGRADNIGRQPAVDQGGIGKRWPGIRDQAQTLCDRRLGQQQHSYQSNGTRKSRHA